MFLFFIIYLFYNTSFSITITGLTFIDDSASPPIAIIESSKKGAKESSASGYVGALEQYQVTAEILGKKVIPDTTLSTDDLKQYDIDLKGETPIDGYVTIKNKQVVDYKLQFDEYLVSYNSEKNKGEATKEKIKGDYTVYKEGEQVTIDGVSYHVIKNSSSYSDSVTLLRDESIGEMNAHPRKRYKSFVTTVADTEQV